MPVSTCDRVGVGSIFPPSEYRRAGKRGAKNESLDRHKTEVEIMRIRAGCGINAYSNEPMCFTSLHVRGRIVRPRTEMHKGIYRLRRLCGVMSIVQSVIKLQS